MSNANDISASDIKAGILKALDEDPGFVRHGRGSQGREEELAQWLEALQRAESIDWVVGAIRCRLTIARYLEQSEAFAMCEEAVRLSRSIGHKKLEAWALGDLADYTIPRVDTEAEQYHIQGIAITREAYHDDPGFVCVCLANYGRFLLHKGDGARALEVLSEALDLARAAGNTEMEGSVLSALMKYYSKIGDSEAQLSVGCECLALWGNAVPARSAIVESSMAIALANLGRFDEALRHGEHAAAMADGIDSGTHLETLANLAEVRRMRNELDIAEELIRICFDLGKPEDDPLRDVHLRRMLAAIHINGGRIDDAIEILLDALRIVEASDLGDGVLCILHAYLVETYMKANRHREALDHMLVANKLELQIRSDEAEQRFRNLDLQHKLELQRQEAERMADQIDRQRAELAAQAMHLARQTELLGRFRSELRAIVRQADRAETAIKAIKQKLQELPCESIDWTKFDAEFQQTYPEFRDKLVAAYPELTKMELKVASLLKLKLQTPDISRLLCISERTVEGHRRNLRKVFSLEPKRSLTGFLTEF